MRGVRVAGGAVAAVGLLCPRLPGTRNNLMICRDLCRLRFFLILLIGAAPTGCSSLETGVAATPATVASPGASPAAQAAAQRELALIERKIDHAKAQGQIAEMASTQAVAKAENELKLAEAHLSLFK